MNQVNLLTKRLAKIYRQSLRSAQQEANALFSELRDFGSSLESDKKFLTRYATAAEERAKDIINQINRTDIAHFANQMRATYIKSVQLLADYDDSINDTSSLEQALLENRTIFKTSFNFDDEANHTLDRNCLKDAHFETSTSCHLKPDVLPRAEHGILPAVIQVSKRQLGAVVAGIGGVIAGVIGAWSSDGTYTRQQLAILTQGLGDQGEELLSLESLVQTEFHVTQQNFLQISKSLANIYDLVIASRHLITINLQAEFINAFLVHVSQIAREISRTIGLMQDMFVHGLLNRFPAHLISREEGERILNRVTQLANEKGLSLYVNTQDALFSADCNIASRTDLFFLLCSIPLKTNVTLKVRYIPHQTFLIGQLQVSLDLSEKYIIHDANSFKTMSELDFFRNCKTRASDKEDFVICDRQTHSIFIKEKANNSTNCQYRLVNNIFTDIAEYCPLIVMPPSSEVIQRIGLTKYKITPLKGLIIVKKICNNKLTQQFVIETPKIFNIESGCQLQTPSHVVGADDMVAGIYTEFYIKGNFQSLVNTSLESLSALKALSDSSKLYQLLERDQILPQLNNSIPLKALNKLISETTLSRSLSHQAKTFGHLMLPSFMSSILLGLLVFAVMLALFLRRRLRARRRTSDPGTSRGNIPGATEATDPEEASRLVPNTGMATPIVRGFHPFPERPPPVRTETPPTTGTRRVTATGRLPARGGPLSLPSEPRHID